MGRHSVFLLEVIFCQLEVIFCQLVEIQHSCGGWHDHSQTARMLLLPHYFGSSSQSPGEAQDLGRQQDKEHLIDI